MPTYAYACPDCGAEFERVQKFTDKPVKKCPVCGKNKVHRVINRVAVAFKGSGFYINDSRSSSAATKTKDDQDKGTEKDAAAPETPATSSSGEPKESKDSTPAKTEPQPAASAEKPKKKKATP